jgi:hypothetical protein
MECVLINKGLDPFGDCHCFDIKNRKRLNVLNLSYQKYFSTRPRSLSQNLRYVPVPVLVHVPGNCQTACDDRLKAGLLRETGQPPGFSRDGWGLCRKFPGWILYEIFSTGI